MKGIKKLFTHNAQFIKFCIVGASNALIAVIVYNIYLYLIGLPFFFLSAYKVGYVLAFVISVFNGFYWSKRFVFKSGAKNSPVKFFLQYIITFLIGLFLMIVFVEWLFINPTIAQLIQLAATTLMNFFGSKFWVFKAAD